MWQSRLEKKVDYGLLSSFYGALLTDRQRQMLNLYCDEDLGEGEIARHLNVSRQCVNDTLKNACLRLDKLESQLGLQARFQRMRSTMQQCQSLLQTACQTPNQGAALSRAITLLDDFLQEEES